MTRFWTTDPPRTPFGLLLVLTLLLAPPIVGYRLGRMDERQLSQPIACEPKQDSIRVVPTRYPKPTDPVRSAP